MSCPYCGGPDVVRPENHQRSYDALLALALKAKVRPVRLPRACARCAKVAGLSAPKSRVYVPSALWLEEMKLDAFTTLAWTKTQPLTVCGDAPDTGRLARMSSSLASQLLRAFLLADTFDSTPHTQRVRLRELRGQQLAQARSVRVSAGRLTLPEREALHWHALQAGTTTEKLVVDILLQQNTAKVRAGVADFFADLSRRVAAGEAP